MTLDRLFGPLYLLGAIGMFILAPIQKRAGKTKHFWAMLGIGGFMLILAISNL